MGMDEARAQEEILSLLFGRGADDLISKMSPDGADLMTPANQKKDKRNRRITSGLSAVGAGAGALGLGVAAKEIKTHGWKGTPKMTRALLPAEAIGLGGEIAATHILHNDTKKGMIKPVPVPKLKKANNITKSYDVKWEGEISKVNHDKQQVFGWASIVELNGEPVVDLQGDYIAIDEVEKAGYDYVIKSRKGGNMHLRDGDNPVHASDMIESFIVTPEKKEALGLPDEMPVGWWVGYQVNDPEVWAMVKDGRRTGFSIHGRGVRKDA